MAMNAPNDDRPARPRPPRLRPVFQLAFCLVFGLGCGMLFDRWQLRAYVPSNAAASFRLMASAWNTIDRYYVDRQAVNGQNLTYGAISGMVDALGDTGHSVFLTPGMVKQLHNSEKGELKGVGLQIDIKNRQMVIEAPLDDSPAQRAGLRSGEIILSVNGHPVSGMTPSEAVSQISGPVGTTVELGILDPKAHRLRMVNIVRAEIKLHDITWAQIPGTQIADLRIASFGDGMDQDLFKALSTIRQQQFKGMVLDMRDNPGGILDEAVVVASQFLSGGNVLLVKDAVGEITPIPVKPGGLATNIPMVVLINNGSASAAEIVAGALGSAHRAELIGETTFGTGTVLNEFPLPGGSALLLAIEEWLTPDGQSFWHKGISPQLTVALPTDVTKLEPITLREMTPELLQNSSDKQLLAALEWLQLNPIGQAINHAQLVPPPK
jgi:carboxyl-terminal processing protease